MHQNKVDQNDDYTFRYQLFQYPDDAYYNRNALNEMLGTQLKNLFDLVIPCFGEEEVKVDGFKLLRDRNVFYEINGAIEAGSDTRLFSSNVSRNASLYEPRIDFVRKQLESLLSVIELESNGEPVKVDGFRLKNLAHWTGPSACDPAEVFEHAATRCNCNCVFCYNKGAPPSLALVNSQRKPDEELTELRTRVKYFSPRTCTSLFPSIGSSCEVLAHPHILEVLRSLREKTGQPFRIVTNGAALRPAMIAGLSRMKPLYLDISLNSADPSRRRALMQDKMPEIAIQALPLLRREGIPYSVVVVPWPLDSLAAALDDLEKTVAYADEHEAHLVQISLPGYTRYFSEIEVFNREEVWSAVVGRVRELRKKYQSPVVAMPTMYEESLYGERRNLPGIIGVVKNSPAFFGGLREGDLILRLNGVNVRNRPQAREILSFLQKNEVKTTTMLIRREGRVIEKTLNLENYSYPYFKETSTHAGIIFLGTGLRAGYLERLKEIIKSRRAKNILFLTSTLVKPVLEQYLTESNFFGSENISLAVPRNRFFGGNIFMGDLLVVQDFIDCIKEYIQKVGKPELVVIPSSPFNLSQWGRDLTGRVYLDIERTTGVPVELLDCATIYD